MEKTIQGLNSKIWYRTLKVFFILVFLFIVAIYIGIISSKLAHTINLEKSTIKCELGNEVLSLKDAGILGPIHYIDTFVDDLIRIKCGKIDFIPSENRFSNLNNEGNYSTNLIYDNNWVGIIVRIIVFTTLLAILFEIIRRIFYYIVLGKIRPPKN